MTPDPHNSPNAETIEGEPIAKRGKVDDVNAQLSSPISSRADKYYAPVQEATISEELLSFPQISIYKPTLQRGVDKCHGAIPRHKRNS